jgi:hypothetical protein
MQARRRREGERERERGGVWIQSIYEFCVANEKQNKIK